ncbi:MAG TPA: hypothetical protein VGH38_14915, partial [Bryobacteraceae bacterium]
ARGALVGFDVPPRFPYHPFANAKRFDCSRTFLPLAELTHALSPDNATASLHPYYRGFITTISGS